MSELRPDLIRSEEAFYGFLDSIGLPHVKTIEEIRELHGVSKSKYYGWPEIQISAEKCSVKPILPMQIGSFHFNDNRDPDLLPPEMFSTFLSVGTDARENHRETLLALEAIFGEPSTETSVSNTVAHHWRFGHATMDIVTWPQDLNTDFSNNEAWMNFPELRSFTHLYIRAGHLPKETQREVEWIESFRSFEFDAEVHTSSIMRDLIGVNAGVLRWHKGLQAETRIGVSADGQALLGIYPTLCLVLELAQARELELVRLEPARGSGHSKIYIHYEDVFSTGRTLRTYSLLNGKKVDSLDLVAKALADRLRLPLKTETHLDD